MKRKLASVQRVIEVAPIAGADAIEAAKINGWQCVVKKNSFAAGDRGVYFEIDAIPPDLPAYRFLWTSWSAAPRRGRTRPSKYRIRTMTLRGCLSWGLLLPLAEAGVPADADDSTDVTELLGVGMQASPPLPPGADDLRAPLPLAHPEDGRDARAVGTRGPRRAARAALRDHAQVRRDERDVPDRPRRRELPRVRAQLVHPGGDKRVLDGRALESSTSRPSCARRGRRLRRCREKSAGRGSRRTRSRSREAAALRLQRVRHGGAPLPRRPGDARHSRRRWELDGGRDRRGGRGVRATTKRRSSRWPEASMQGRRASARRIVIRPREEVFNADARGELTRSRLISEPTVPAREEGLSAISGSFSSARR